MTTSWAESPETETWWVCCKCQREVNPAVWKEECPECNHAKCDECKSVQHEIPPIRDHFRRLAQYTDQSYCAHDTPFNSGTIEGSRRGAIFVSGNYPVTNPLKTYPAPMASWWQCCQCSREVNYDLFGDDCPDCGHIRDDGCHDL